MSPAVDARRDTHPDAENVATKATAHTRWGRLRLKLQHPQLDRARGGPAVDVHAKPTATAPNTATTRARRWQPTTRTRTPARTRDGRTGPGRRRRVGPTDGPPQTRRPSRSCRRHRRRRRSQHSTTTGATAGARRSTGRGAATARDREPGRLTSRPAAARRHPVSTSSWYGAAASPTRARARSAGVAAAPPRRVAASSQGPAASGSSTRSGSMA